MKWLGWLLELFLAWWSNRKKSAQQQIVETANEAGRVSAEITRETEAQNDTAIAELDNNRRSDLADLRAADSVRAKNRIAADAIRRSNREL